MLHIIHLKTNLGACKPASSAKRIVMADTLKQHTTVYNESKTEQEIESTVEKTFKLNELAKKRPFNILYRVKKYDPL